VAATLKLVEAAVHLVQDFGSGFIAKTLPLSKPRKPP
jgi:hypothetical protein